MKKILVYGISGNIGGIEMFMHNVISNANKEKVSFDILTFYNHISFQQEYLDMGVNIYTITSRHESPLRNKNEMKAFFEKHAKEYDVVWCNLAELINIDILKMAKRYGIKKRIIHSHSITTTRNKLLTILHYINKLLIDKIATDFWACSEMAGRWFYNESIIKSDKFVVIKNAIDVGRYKYSDFEREKTRKELDVENDFVVGHVGRFSIKEKNTLFLLEIFSEIAKIKSNARLLLVGDGEDRNLVEEKIDELGIRDKVILLGFRKDVERLLNAMDVFLLPSHCEGLGIVLIEAQANGLRCYTSDIVVPKEVAITDLVTYIGLDKSPVVWAEKIIASANSERNSRLEQVKCAGYDVEIETKKNLKIFRPL